MAGLEGRVNMSLQGNSSTHTYGCAHYKRKCKLVSPCCKNNYVCRFCHDETESHQLDRAKITQVECLECGFEQDITNTCANDDCAVQFGKYFCSLCKLFDDEDKGQYHCDGCGLCRVGHRDKFFHCNICDLCLPKGIKNTHKCIEKMSKANCPVCLEDIHTSRVVSHVPPCGHLIHRPCFDDLIKAGFYACPTCATSMINMNEVWKSLDDEIEETPMPSEYSDLLCFILCRDCHRECLTVFHVLGHKCSECGSYNTVRNKGGLFRRQRCEAVGNESSDDSASGGAEVGATGHSDEDDKAGHE
ncbi:hypothetical protein Pcinc_034996 [Petrolisthes cinctipes]|uniref:RING finger and CHY zinc finger domain-containing protein 1 n=1 Tax=Petrolisthes cinctipes TaxID=88211 RepID=A0AAE1BXM6_PETCI|nr:hypothetical protein Pcinc_034996 [Petrolisthes cinctipes]